MTIDEMVIKLILDARQYMSESQKVNADLREAKKEQTKQRKDQADVERKAAQEQSQQQKDTLAAEKKQGEAIGGITKNLLGMFAVLVGANGLKDFIQGTTQAAISTGIAAQNAGMATKEMGAFQNMMALNGESADAAAGTITNLTNAMADFRLRGITPPGAMLSGAATIGADLRNDDAVEIFKKLAAYADANGRDPFKTGLAGRQLGFSAAEINEALKGLDQVKKDLAAGGENALDDKEIAKVRELNNAWVELNKTIKKGGADLLAAYAPGLEKILDFIERVSKATGPHGEDPLTSWSESHIPGVKWFGDTVRGSQWGKDLQSWWSTPDGSPAPAGAAPSGRASSETDAFRRYFIAKGWSPDQAAGIAAGIMAESGGVWNNTNPQSGAWGLGQWLGDRKDRLFARYGSSPTTQQQLEYLNLELRGGDRGGSAVAGAHSASDALMAYIVKFMRPAAGRETTGDFARGSRFLAALGFGGSGGATTVNIGQITVNTNATDAQGMAKGLRGALSQNPLIGQANTGLR